MDNERRSPIDRLLFATFLKGRTSSRDLWDEKGEMSPEDNQKIVNETNEIINDDSTYPFISYLTDLLAKSEPSDAAKSCMTSSTRLPQRPGMTAPIFSVCFWRS